MSNDINLFHLNLGWGNNFDSVYVYLYNIVNTQYDVNYNVGKTAFVGISPTYSDTVVNKAFYETIKKTDYEVSLRNMSLPADGDQIIVENGAELTLIAGKEIVLQPGFEAKAGSEVTVTIDTGLVNRIPITVSEWPTTIEEENDGLYVPVRNANSYELTVRDVEGNIKYQTAGLIRDTPARIWCRDYEYDPSMTYDCTVRFKNNFGRALEHTFRINDPDNRTGDCEMRMAKKELTDDNTSLKVYPNPTSGWISVELSGLSNCEISLYNAKGQPCLHDVCVDNSVYYIDASQFPPGTYYIFVRSGEIHKTSRIVIK